MKTVLAIAAGGALGAVARYYVSIGTGVLLGTAFSAGERLSSISLVVSRWAFSWNDGNHVVAECRAARLPNRCTRCLNNVLCIYARRRLVAWARGNVG